MDPTHMDLNSQATAKTRRRFSEEAVKKLKEVFQQTDNPNMDTLTAIAAEIGEDTDRVKIWFTSERSRVKKAGERAEREAQRWLVNGIDVRNPITSAGGMAKVLEFANAVRARLCASIETEGKIANSAAKKRKVDTKPAAPLSSTMKKTIFKRIASSLKAKIAKEKFFFEEGTDRDINILDGLKEHEFNDIFGDFGKQTQPTDTNNPTSKVIIRECSDPDAIAGVFAPAGYKKLFVGSSWYRGGLKFGTMSASTKKGAVELEPMHMSVKYSKSSGQLRIQLNVRARDDRYSDEDYVHQYGTM